MLLNTPYALLQNEWVDIQDPVNRDHPLAQGLFAWWLAMPLIGGSVRWYDLSGLYSGLLTNMISGTASGWQSTTRPGGFGHMLFDGSNDIVDVGSQSIFQALAVSPCTVSAWVKPSLDGTNRVIVGNAWDAAGWHLRQVSSNKLGFLRLTDGNNFVRADTSVPSVGWHMLTGVWTGSAMLSYLDGIRDTTLASQGTVTTTTSALPLYMGNVSGQSVFWLGPLDDVRFYNKALTDNLIFEMYENSILNYSGLLDRSFYTHQQINPRTLYAKSAGGVWSAAGTWATSSGGADSVGPPTYADSTVLDGNSGNVSLDSSSALEDQAATIDLTAYVGTLSMLDKTLNLYGTGTVWNAAGIAPVQLSAGASTISINDASPTAKTFAGGGLTYYNLTLQPGGTGIVSITGADTFRGNVSVTGGPKTLTLPASATTTVGGDLKIKGSSGNVVTVNSSSGGNAATVSISAGPAVASCDWLSVQDIAFTGGTTWYAGGNSVNVSGNSGITFTDPPQVSWATVAVPVAVNITDPVNRNHPLAQGLSSWWMSLPGLDGSLTLYDLMGQKNGTLTGMTAALTSGWKGTTRPGGYGELVYDGVNDYVTMGDVYNVTGAFTVAAWIRATSFSNTPMILSKYNGGAAAGVSWYLGFSSNDGTNLILLIAGATLGTIYISREYSVALSLNKWYRVLGTYDGGTTSAAIKLYLNGTRVDDTDVVLGVFVTPFSTTTAVTIGQGFNNNVVSYLFTGSIDDVRMWQGRALTADDVMDDYTNSATGCPDLLNMQDMYSAAKEPNPFNPQWAANAYMLDGGLPF